MKKRMSVAVLLVAVMLFSILGMVAVHAGPPPPPPAPSMGGSDETDDETPLPPPSPDFEDEPAIVKNTTVANATTTPTSTPKPANSATTSTTTAPTSTVAAAKPSTAPIVPKTTTSTTTPVTPKPTSPVPSIPATVPATSKSAPTLPASSYAPSPTLASTSASSSDIEAIKSKIDKFSLELGQKMSQVQTEIKDTNRRLDQLDSAQAKAIGASAGGENSIFTLPFAASVIINAVLLSAAMYSLILYREKRAKKLDSNPSLRKYITSALSAGGSFPAIKQKLVRSGWTEKDVDGMYKDMLRNL